MHPERGCSGPVVKGILLAANTEDPRPLVSRTVFPRSPRCRTVRNTSTPGTELHSGYKCCSTGLSHLHYSFHVTISGDPLPYHIDCVVPSSVPHFFVQPHLTTSPALLRGHCCTMLWLRGLLTASLLWAPPHVNAVAVDSAQNDESCQSVALDYMDSGSYLVDANSEGNFRYASMFQGV